MNIGLDFKQRICPEMCIEHIFVHSERVALYSNFRNALSSLLSLGWQLRLPFSIFLNITASLTIGNLKME